MRQFSVEDCVASSTQAGQIAQMLKLLAPVVIAPVVCLQVVLAVADLASVVRPFLHRLGNCLPVVSLEVILVVHSFNLIDQILILAITPLPLLEQAQKWREGEPRRLVFIPATI
jgi:hypothetical protein